MSLATLQSLRTRDASGQLLTAGELADLPEMLDCQQLRYELQNGRLIFLPLPDGDHARCQGLAFKHLMSNAEEPGLGMGYGAAGIVLRRTPDTVLAPDAIFVLKKSLPVSFTPEDYLETIPEIVVEIQSRIETFLEMRAKRDEYFAAGVQEVWWLLPKAQSAVVRDFEGRETSFKKNDTLVSQLLPGFGVSVEKLFGPSSMIHS